MLHRSYILLVSWDDLCCRQKIGSGKMFSFFHGKDLAQLSPPGKEIEPLDIFYSFKTDMDPIDPKIHLFCVKAQGDHPGRRRGKGGVKAVCQFGDGAPDLSPDRSFCSRILVRLFLDKWLKKIGHLMPPFCPEGAECIGLYFRTAPWSSITWPVPQPELRSSGTGHKPWVRSGCFYNDLHCSPSRYRRIRSGQFRPHRYCLRSR